MDYKPYIPVIGWIVTFFLGVLSAGVLVPRLTRKRKVISWAVMAETELVPRELAETLALPVVLKVGEHQLKSLSIVQIRFGSGGNELIENVSLSVSFGTDSHILKIRATSDLGEYSKKISWATETDRFHLNVGFINPGTYFELEILLSNYERGNADVDLALPGVEIKRQQASNWDLAMSVNLARSLGLNFFGLRYDPSARAMGEIADELKSIRKSLSNR